MDKSNIVKSIFKDAELKHTRPVPFWSWNNKLDEEELRRQIRDMKEAGIGGFIMHARTGLKTEYLGDEWFSCVAACLDEARKLDMNAWMYDENGWPSGFVEGRMLKNHDHRANYLEYKLTDFYDEDALAVFSLNDGVAKRVESGEKLDKYHCVYRKVSPANTDILNPEVVDEFIRLTYDEYYKRFPQSFGRELVGFFTDEPQYYRYATPFTKQLPEDYKSMYGEDLRDGLLYLFISSEHGYQFRYRYYNLLNHYYVNNFYKKIYDWCEKHNCLLTGHSVEEGGLSTQMWGGAAVMPTYEFQQVPGVDFLGRNCTTDLVPKQASSVNSQLGTKYLLTETFGCAGYDVTPIELKSTGDYQFFQGVNLLCHHLYPYSIASQGKYDHPPVFSRHSNWFDGFKVFNDYFTKLGYVVANTSEIIDIAVISPMKSVYLEYIRALDYQSVKQLEDSYQELIRKLAKHGIQYNIIDENILLRHGKAQDGKVVVGNMHYGAIIVPDMPGIASNTYEVLRQFTKDGGKLFMPNAPKYVDGIKTQLDISGNIDFNHILQNRYVNVIDIKGNAIVAARRGDMGEFLFIKNKSHTDTAQAFISGLGDNYLRIDISEDTAEQSSDVVELKPAQGLIFYKHSTAKAIEPVKVRQVDITGGLKFEDISQNYLIIDRAAISYDGNSFEDVADTQQVFENLLRKDYDGDLYVRYSFNIKDMPDSLTLMMEKSHYDFIKINGKDIELEDSDFDVFFGEADIADLVNIGDNTVLYKLHYYQHDGVHFALFDPEATESVRNCLSYDTEIERIYLKGDFRLDSEYNIVRPSGDVPVRRDLYTQGLPFFYGNVTYSTDFVYNGGRAQLTLEGRYTIVKLEINGNTDYMVLDNQKDITKHLKKGKNLIKITLYSSPRNLFGPHHFAPDREPFGVGPYNFTMRQSWGDGMSPDYTSEYNLVDFGLESAVVSIT